MSSISIGIIVGLIVYGVFLAIISRKAQQKTQGKSAEFFVAGRTVGPVMLLGTLCLSIWSALSFYGWPAAAYRTGVGYFSGATGTFFMAVMGPCFMYPLWLLGKKYNYMTPVSLVTHRYNSRPLSLLFAFICIIFMVPYIATQIIGVANGADVSSGGQIAFWLIVAITTIYIFGHIVGGGSNSVVAADTFAGFVGVGIVIFSTYLMGKAIFGAGGPSAVTQHLLETNPDYLRHSGAFGSWFSNLGLTLSAGAGLVVWPHILVRSFMGRGPQVFKLQAVVQPLLVCMLFSLFLFQGVWLGRAAFPEMETAATDSIIPLMALQYAPAAMTALLVVGVFAFGLSSADSQVMVISAVIEKDVYNDTSEQTNKKRLYGWMAALMVCVLLVVAFRPALLVNYAYRFSSPGFFQMAPALVGAMFWRRATAAGAIIGTIGGIFGVVVSLFIYNPIPTMNPVLWGIIFNVPLFIIFSLATKPDEQRTAETYGFISEHFKVRNNSTFKTLLAITGIVICQDVFTCYMPNPILFGWLPFQLFNHWLVAIECSILGYLFCKNRFGPMAGAQTIEEAFAS